MCDAKDAAKFISGAAAMETINHLVLATTDLLPMSFYGIEISPQINLVILVAWIGVFIATFYYGFSKK